MSGEGQGPEEWRIAELCATWNALPFSGGVLEQPVRLMVLGASLRQYAKAYRAYESDPSGAPGKIRDLVLMTARDSALARERGE